MRKPWPKKSWHPIKTPVKDRWGIGPLCWTYSQGEKPWCRYHQWGPSCWVPFKSPGGSGQGPEGVPIRGDWRARDGAGWLGERKRRGVAGPWRASRGASGGQCGENGEGGGGSGGVCGRGGGGEPEGGRGWEGAVEILSMRVVLLVDRYLFQSGKSIRTSDLQE